MFLAVLACTANLQVADICAQGAQRLAAVLGARLVSGASPDVHDVVPVFRVGFRLNPRCLMCVTYCLHASRLTQATSSNLVVT